jgi:hypothetical protein
LCDRIARGSRGRREIGWRGPIANIVENDGSETIELQQRLFDDGHGGRN